MKRSAVLAPLVLAISIPALAQQIFRVDPTPVMTTSGTTPVGGYPALYAVPGASVSITTDAAGTMPATTYANITGNPSCPVNAPVVVAGTSICTPTTGAQGQFGFFVGSGTYYYQITLPNGFQSERYPITINTLGVTQITAGSGVSISPSSGIGNVTINATGSIPLVSTYNWGPVASASVLTGGNPFTLTLTPVPLGVNANNPTYSMSITGCSGGNQTVAITGGTAVSGGSSGTVIFTPSVSCALGFAIGSATAGLQESICALPSAGGQVIINNTPTLLSNVNVCNKTDVAVAKEPGSVVSGSYTILGSSITGLSGGVWIGNNAYTTDASAVFPALTGVLIGNGTSPVTAQAQLNVNQGGTGAATLAVNGVLYGNGTSPVQAATAGTADQVLVTPHGGGAPVMGQVDVSQSAAVKNALTRVNGGLNSTSPGTGILRDGNTPAASELSGDATTSGSNAVTVSKVNGVAIPNSQNPVSTDSGGHFVAPTVQGNGGKVQLATGGTTTGNCLKYDAVGNAIDNGTPCNSFTLPSGLGAQLLQITPNLSNVTTFRWTTTQVNALDYVWTQTPGGTLTGSVVNTITLTPCPLGVNGTDSFHYLYVSGGTGTAESVLMTGGSCTSGLTTGTVSFTPANSHTGAWTIATATNGVQEAVQACAANCGVHMPALPSGNYAFYAPVRVQNLGGVSIFGDGRDSTVVTMESTFGAGQNAFEFVSTGSSSPYLMLTGNSIANIGVNGSAATSAAYALLVQNQSFFYLHGLYTTYTNNGIDWNDCVWCVGDSIGMFGLAPMTGVGVKIEGYGQDQYLSHLIVDGNGNNPCGAPCNPYAGVEVVNGAVSVTDSEFDFCEVGVALIPGAGQTVTPSSFTNVWSDSDYEEGILIQPSSASGTVGPVRFNSVWAGSSGIGILVNDNGGTINGLQFNGVQGLNNLGDGINLNTAANVQITGSQFAGNSYQMTGGTVNTSGTVVTLVTAGSLGQGFITAMTDHTITINSVVYTVYSIQGPTQITLTTSAGTQSGVSFAFGVSAAGGIGLVSGSGNVTITGTHSGNGFGEPAMQAYGVSIQSAFTGILTMTGNDFSGNATNPLFSTYTGSSIIESSNNGLSNVTPPTISSASSISLGNTLPEVVYISGTTAIATVTGGQTGQRVLFVFTNGSPGGFTTGGNIGRAITAAQNQGVALTYQAGTSKWY